MASRTGDFFNSGRTTTGNTAGGIELQGWKQFQEKVKAIPSKFKRQAMLPVLRKSTGSTIRAVRSELRKHDSSGNLWQSVGNITGKSKTFPNVLVGYRIKGQYKGFHGHFLEHGTKQRFRGSKAGSTRRKRKISTGAARGFNIISTAAKTSEAAAVAELEREMLIFTEKELSKLFR
jgi:hypothetical protein